MKSLSSAISLMLISAILLLLPNLCASVPHVHKHHHGPKLFPRDNPSIPTAALSTTSSSLSTDYGFSLSGTASPCSGSNCATPTALPASVTCPASNGTAYISTAQNDHYNIICNVDFIGQNIYPFVLATSFDDCMTQCENFNIHNANYNTRCAGFVFAPERVNDADDCYLKSAFNSAVSATISLIGATTVTPTATSTVAAASTISSKSDPISNLLPRRGKISKLTHCRPQVLRQVSRPLRLLLGHPLSQHPFPALWHQQFRIQNQLQQTSRSRSLYQRYPTANYTAHLKTTLQASILTILQRHQSSSLRMFLHPGSTLI